MPKFPGSSGCYNRHDARTIGLVPAIVWNDMIDRAEHFDMNPMWYDQKDAAERLGIEYHRVNRAVKTLEEEGRITTKGGYRPKSSIKTTWVTINSPEISYSNFRNEQNEISSNEQNEISLYNETKERDLPKESQEEDLLSVNILFPKLVSKFKRAGFTIVNKKQLKEKTEALLNMFKEEGTVITINQVIDAADNFINGNWEGKSLQRFLSPNVFPYCLKNDNPTPQRPKGLEHFRKLGD